MSEIVGVFVLILGVAGVLLNNRKLRVCFILWMVSNILSAGIHVWLGPWTLVLRDMTFLILSIEGYILWGRK